MLLAAVVAELRQALRDTNTLLFSLLFPLLFIPFVLWLASQASTLVDSWEKSLVPRVAAAAELSADIPEKVMWVPPGSPADAVLTSNGADYRLDYPGTNPTSLVAVKRLRAAFAPAFEIKRHDLAPRSERFISAVSAGLPMLILVMAAVAGMYPAIEAVVADRERGTLDTSLVTAAPRWIFPVAKLISVGAVTLVAVLGCVLSTLASIAHFALVFGVELDLPLGRLLALLPLAALGALVSAAVATASASPARDFKQAQNFTTTACSLLLLLPMISIAAPEAPVTPANGFVPYLNLTLVMRDIIRGEAHLGWIAVSTFESLAIVAVGAVVALRFLRNSR